MECSAVCGPPLGEFPAHREVRAARAFVPQPVTRESVRFRCTQTTLSELKGRVLRARPFMFGWHCLTFLFAALFQYSSAKRSWPIFEYHSDTNTKGQKRKIR